MLNSTDPALTSITMDPVLRFVGVGGKQMTYAMPPTSTTGNTRLTLGLNVYEQDMTPSTPTTELVKKLCARDRPFNDAMRCCEQVGGSLITPSDIDRNLGNANPQVAADQMDCAETGLNSLPTLMNGMGAVVTSATMGPKTSCMGDGSGQSTYAMTPTTELAKSLCEGNKQLNVDLLFCEQDTAPLTPTAMGRLLDGLLPSAPTGGSMTTTTPLEENLCNGNPQLTPTDLEQLADQCLNSNPPLEMESTGDVKSELKATIMVKRLQKGLPIVEPEYKAPEPEVLNQEEVSRRDHRRARNRVAATKCRNKRRKAAEDVQKEADILESKNVRLRYEEKKLKEEIQKLMEVWNFHQAHCCIGETSNEA